MMTDSEITEIRDWIENKYESAEHEMQMWDKIFNALDRKTEAEDFRKPKKVLPFSANGYYKCPTCGEAVSATQHQPYCDVCGQALDWKGVY